MPQFGPSSALRFRRQRCRGVCPRSGALLVVIVAATLAASQPASAEPPDEGEGEFVPRPLMGPVAIELRGGAQLVAGQAATVICAEIRLFEVVGIESCGAGPPTSGTPEEAVDMSHYRIEGTLPAFESGRSRLALQLGVGIAEVQVGLDESGLRFGEAKSAEQNEGAGADAALSAKFDFWPAERVALSAELTAGAANIPAATVVFDQRGPWVGYSGLSLGMRF